MRERFVRDLATHDSFPELEFTFGERVTAVFFMDVFRLLFPAIKPCLADLLSQIVMRLMVYERKSQG